MKTEDFQYFDFGKDIDTDLCIVGSGPAGLTIAQEYSGTTIETLILETGGLTPETDSDAQSEIESIGVPRLMEPTQVRNRIFGGTSHSWSGRCAPFEEIDFEVRDWVPYSGWPISRREMDPYLQRAATHLGISHTCYDDHLWNLFGPGISIPDIDSGKLRSIFWQFSRDRTDRLDYMRLGRKFLSETAHNIRVLLHATVTQIITDANASGLRSIEITNPQGKRAWARCKALVLCAGGIENARLLLCSNRLIRAGVGNRYDMVGRFLMDHPRTTLGEFDVTQSHPLRERYGLHRVEGERPRHFFKPGLGLSSQYQRKMGLLNCAAWLDEDRDIHDPWNAAKRLLTNSAFRSLADLTTVLGQPQLLLQGCYDRLVRGKGVRHKLRRLVLECIVEQRPDPASRVRLSNRTDRLGVPLPQLNWKISDQERETVATLGKLVADEFERIGLPLLSLAEWVRTGRIKQAQFVDVGHPTGTTRMSSNPATGVVDKNCQIHGLEGIYVAGSSVFPTTSHANPTLMIVALSIRLADWLKPRLLASKSILIAEVEPAYR